MSRKCCEIVHNHRFDLIRFVNHFLRGERKYRYHADASFYQSQNKRILGTQRLEESVTPQWEKNLNKKCLQCYRPGVSLKEIFISEYIKCLIFTDVFSSFWWRWIRCQTFPIMSMHCCANETLSNRGQVAWSLAHSNQARMKIGWWRRRTAPHSPAWVVSISFKMGVAWGVSFVGEDE